MADTLSRTNQLPNKMLNTLISKHLILSVLYQKYIFAHICWHRLKWKSQIECKTKIGIQISKQMCSNLQLFLKLLSVKQQYSLQSLNFS